MFSDVDVATALRNARLAAGLTQEQLASRCGGKVTTGTISKIERGDTLMPDFETVARLARALGTDHQRTFIRDVISAALELTDATAVGALQQLNELTPRRARRGRPRSRSASAK